MDKTEKLTIKYSVNNQNIYLESTDREHKIVSGSVKYLNFIFDFSEEWTGDKFALFYETSKFQKKPMLVRVVLDEETSEYGCLVPPEVIKCPSFGFSLYAMNGEQLITSETKTVPVHKSGYHHHGLTPEPVMPFAIPVYTTGDSMETKLPFLRQRNNIMEWSANGGEWSPIAGEIGPVGPQGEKGEQGEQGIQGVQGIQGISGKDGKDGKDGKNGENGRDGIDGVDGLNGFSPEVEVSTDTSTEYTLKITDSDNVIETPNLKGLAGDPGSVWLSGAGIPQTTSGNIGDWYFDTNTYETFEKTAVNIWTKRGLLGNSKAVSYSSVTLVQNVPMDFKFAKLVRGYYRITVNVLGSTPGTQYNGFAVYDMMWESMSSSPVVVNKARIGFSDYNFDLKYALVGGPPLNIIMQATLIKIGSTSVPATLTFNITPFDNKISDNWFVEKPSDSAGTLINVTEYKWDTLVLQNGAVAGSPAPQYCKIGNIVYLSGNVTAGSTSGTVISTLPAGYRPSGERRFIAVSDGTNRTNDRYCSINSSGAVTLGAVGSGGTNTAQYINDISFIAEG